jgi:DNA-binding response OmpR family regulator
MDAEPAEHRILVVEDDPALRSTLAMVLEDEGLQVESHPTGEAALARFDDVDPDLAIIDLRLPGMHGLDVVRAVRERSAIAVIILTAQSSSQDVVAGLDAGADDYVTKPFDVMELLARIRANIRRSAGDNEELRDLVVGELHVRPRTAEVHIRGEPIEITRTELKLLNALAQADAGVVSREELLMRVWNYDYLGDSRMVDAHIRRLRLKIEEDPADPKLLLTVRGIGYRLVDPAGS